MACRAAAAAGRSPRPSGSGTHGSWPRMFFSAGSPGRRPPAPSCRTRPRARGMKCRCRRAPRALQTRRDDHAVAHQVVALRHHLALVHADAQPQAVSLGAQRVLNGDGTAQRLHRAGELHEEAVACGLEQPAAMRGRERFDDIGAQCCERAPACRARPRRSWRSSRLRRPPGSRRAGARSFGNARPPQAFIERSQRHPGS